MALCTSVIPALSNEKAGDQWSLLDTSLAKGKSVKFRGKAERDTGRRLLSTSSLY